MHYDSVIDTYEQFIFLYCFFVVDCFYGNAKEVYWGAIFMLWT
jgi:hypothetical protein